MAFNAYIKIPGAEGNSTVRGHKGEIEVLSWGWGIKQEVGSPTGGGAGAGKPQASDFTFLMEPGLATPPLAVAVCTGDRIDGDVVFIAEENIRSRTGKDSAYIKIVFSDVLISSYQTSGSGGGNPTDQVSLNFAKIEIEYADERGRKKGSFCDFQAGRGGS